MEVKVILRQISSTGLSKPNSTRQDDALPVSVVAAFWFYSGDDANLRLRVAIFRGDLVDALEVYFAWSCGCCRALLLVAVEDVIADLAAQAPGIRIT